MIASLFLAALVGLAPPGAVTARDNPNDQGGAIVVSWTAPPATRPDSTKPDSSVIPLAGFRIYRSLRPLGTRSESAGPDSVMSLAGFVQVNQQPATSTEYIDSDSLIHDGVPYYYQVEAFNSTDSARSAVVGPVVSRAQWFNTTLINILVATIVICGLFLIYLELARKGAKMYIRKIAGLDAIDDALGRATEMGKPILFSFGLGYITDLVVIAALPLLRKIAKKSAEYSTRLLVPNSDPIVMTAAQETVKEAYTEMGRPDFYNADNVNFLTSDQFGYAAGVDGIILREKPGAIFWLGTFFAESLIMAETGHSVGAIQLAGTTETAQLPFFVAACDYTMIGEEILAASCYLRPEPIMLGTLKGEDFIRFWLIVLITATVLLGTTGAILSKQVPVLNTIFDTVVRWATPAY
jgi:hypothetical protein